MTEPAETPTADDTTPLDRALDAIAEQLRAAGQEGDAEDVDDAAAYLRRGLADADRHSAPDRIADALERVASAAGTVAAMIHRHYSEPAAAAAAPDTCGEALAWLQAQDDYE